MSCSQPQESSWSLAKQNFNNTSISIAWSLSLDRNLVRNSPLAEKSLSASTLLPKLEVLLKVLGEAR